MSAKRTQRKRPNRRRPKKTKRRRRSRRGGGPKPVPKPAGKLKPGDGPKPGLIHMVAAAATIAGTAAAAAYMGHRPQQVPVAAAATAATATDDDVAIVLITTHGSIMPTTTIVGNVAYLEGRPLLGGLDDITIYKMNAVSPGICNFLGGKHAVSHAQVLASIFGYKCVPTPDDSYAIQEGSYKGMVFPSMYDVADNFKLNAMTLQYMFQQVGHERGKYKPLTGDDVPVDGYDMEQVNDAIDGYDKEEHSYKLHKMTQDTPIFNKVFSMTDAEQEGHKPYDWDITMFDMSGPRSLIAELLGTGYARVEDETIEDETIEEGVLIKSFITSTVDILSYLHLNGKRRIIIVDMTCNVSPSPAGEAFPEVSRHDTAGRGASRNMKDIPHG